MTVKCPFGFRLAPGSGAGSNGGMGGNMSADELLRKVHLMIDGCFARGMELSEVLVEIENYIDALEG